MKPIRDIFRSYAVFDAQGRHVNGTDKESNHAYGDAYESLFSKPAIDRSDTLHYIDPEYDPMTTKTRDTVELMMEVGVADGSSLCAWRECFPNALCVGMDIHHSDRAHGERIEFYLGDQRSKEDCERAAAGRQFDLIVEDATHQLADTLVTLLYLWPFVKPGGLYVVEEFADIGSLRKNVLALFRVIRWTDEGDEVCDGACVEIIDTTGPTGGSEPLVVLRKPL